MGSRVGSAVSLAAWLALTMTAISCTKGSGQWGNAVAKAATVAAVEVGAAAANRGLTGCYTTCGFGTICDEETGLCVPQGECVSAGVRGRGADCGKTAKYLEATATTNVTPASELFDDSCAGFCLSSEKCVVFRGDLDCVAK